jgi:hypothetical protein
VSPQVRLRALAKEFKELRRFRHDRQSPCGGIRESSRVACPSPHEMLGCPHAVIESAIVVRGCPHVVRESLPPSHTRQTVGHKGLEERITGVRGEVVKKAIA